jgi:hypothetical protein
MLRARAQRMNSNKFMLNQTNTISSPASPRDLVGGSYDLQKYARLYAILGTPPTFDLSRGQSIRRKHARKFGGGRYRISTSTPRAGKMNRFFGLTGSCTRWGSLARRESQWKKIAGKEGRRVGTS